MRIRKFNETYSLDNSSIEECFIDFIDLGATVETGEDYGDGRSYFEVVIPFPNVTDEIPYYGKNIDERLSVAEDLVEFYNNVKVCIERVNAKFDNITVNDRVERGRYQDSYFDESLFILILPNFK